MKGVVLSWTRIARPPAGFEPGRVVVLVEAQGKRLYAHWPHASDPPVDGEVELAEHAGQWQAAPARF